MRPVKFSNGPDTTRTVFANFDIEHDRNSLDTHSSNFLIGQRHRLASRTDEAGYTTGIANHVPCARIHHKIDRLAAALLRPDAPFQTTSTTILTIT